jgi:hypothetical protein
MFTFWNVPLMKRLTTTPSFGVPTARSPTPSPLKSPRICARAESGTAAAT